MARTIDSRHICDVLDLVLCAGFLNRQNRGTDVFVVVPTPIESVVLAWHRYKSPANAETRYSAD